MAPRPIALLAAATLASLTGGCSLLRPSPEPPEPWFTESGLVIFEFTDLDGPGLAVGDTATLHYTARLHHGEPFDSSRDRGKPITFELGAGAVPAGLDEGLVGMVIGEVRRIIVPPHLAYGDAGVPGVVPPGATVAFDVELLE